MGRDGILYYSFDTNDELIEIDHYFTEQHTDLNDYINDFESLKEELIKQYGQPFVEDIVWKDDKFKDDPNNYGLAVASGDLEYYVIWFFEKEGISLGLDGVDNEIWLHLNFSRWY